MLHALIEYAADVLVGEKIEYLLALAAVFDKSTRLQYSKLMRDRGLRHRQQRGDIADAHSLLKQHIKYFYARGIGKDAVQLGEIVKRFLVGQRRLYLLDNVGMRAVYVAAFDFIVVDVHFDLRSARRLSVERLARGSSFYIID